MEVDVRILPVADSGLVGLKKLAEQHGINVRRVAEVGVGHPRNSYVAEFIETDDPPLPCPQVLLVEPNVSHFQELWAKWGGFFNVRIYNVAITEFPQAVSLLLTDRLGDDQTCFVAGRTHEAPAHKIYQVKDLDLAAQEVVGIPFRLIDNGPDGINIDCEGSEWDVLRTMDSRPSLIAIELFAAGGYVHPKLDKIEAWMKRNGYHEIDHDLRDKAQNRVYLKSRDLGDDTNWR